MRLLTPLLGSVLAVATPAQLAPGAIAAGNAEFEWTSFPSSATATDGRVNFRVAGPGSTDHVYQCLWFWRLDGDPREYALHGGAGQGPVSATYAGDRATLVWTNLENRGLAALLDARVYSTGAAAGMAIHKLTVLNRTASPVRLNLFAYVDVDQCASSYNTARAYPTVFHQALADPACAVTGEVLAVGADRYEVAGFDTLRAKLTNAAPDDLSDRGLAFGPGDYTAAWQWRSRVLAPGASLTAHVVLAEGFAHTGCTGQALAVPYGTAKPGSRGLPALDATAVPVLGRAQPLVVANGLPGSAPYFVLGRRALTLPVPRIGTLYVDPSAATLFFGVPFDATGSSTTVLTLPNLRVLCGADVYLQAFVVDPGAAGGIAHTGAVAWLLGGVH